MAELPSGTVTFLLTDVEGSTALWEEATEAMRAALARHDALFEEAIAAHSGVHVRPRGEGDSRFAVFSSAEHAVSAALALQHTFAAEHWTTPRPIKVRIGIHTGEAEPLEGDYYGSTVNRCARIRALGHGGQILLSEATATLVRDDLTDGTTLFDLGTYRLRGLTRPERILQVTASDMAANFPPLASVDSRPNNLPAQTTSLIGRDRELSDIHRLLLRDDVRLLTLTGPGGAGKTRLALQAAADILDRFSDGVFFVDLAPVTDPSLVTSTIAAVLGLSKSGENPIDDLRRYLQHRPLLLVLDNFEQIVSAGTVVTDLLTASAGLRVLVTSRAALQVRGEHEFDVPPLTLPDRVATPEALQQYPAVALFVERVQAIHPAFALTVENMHDVTTICTRLDGLPLALELAAARSRSLPPAAMARRLEQRLPLLNSGPRDLPARQRTLRDTIAWSYDLLTPAEQRVFRRLAVFMGSFMLDGVEAIAGQEEPSIDAIDTIERLVTQSLVRVDRDRGPEPRFRMLETIREYALECLEASLETASVCERHLRWCADLLERTVRDISGPRQATQLDRVEDEHDNLRAALAFADRTGDVGGHGLRIAVYLGGNFWTIRGYHTEGRTWLRRLLRHAPARSKAQADGLRVAGNLAQRQNDYEAASALLGEAVAIYRQLDDRPGLAIALRNLGVVPHHLGQYDAAQAMFEESLDIARDLGDRSTELTGLRNLADLAQDRGDYPRAVALYNASLKLAREAQFPHDIAYVLRGLGNVARAQGQYERAGAFLRESLTLLKPIQDRRCIPLTLEGLACITVGIGWADRAARLLSAAHAMQARTGAPSPPAGQADYRRTVADARQALGVEQFERAWADGAAMSLDEAVELALTEQTLATGTPESQAQRSVPLSPREREVVAAIARGLSNREISDTLTISVRTVERHIENVYNRLGISGKAGRAIVTAYALRHGIAVPEE